MRTAELAGGESIASSLGRDVNHIASHERLAMSLLKSLSLSTLSTAARLVASLVTVAVVARVLGPAAFGVLMLFMAAATLLAIASNFGLVTYLMREVGRQPAQAAATFSAALGAKILATAVAALAAILALPFIDASHRWIFLLLLGAMFAEGLCEFLNAGFRARARFDIEAKLALAAALINSAIVGLVAWQTESLVAI